MLTATVCIGNSDNKLEQVDWSRFCVRVDNLIGQFCGEVTEMHFCGASRGDAPYQNACWVFGIYETDVPAFKAELELVRIQFDQDSAALVLGTTEFV